VIGLGTSHSGGYSHDAVCFAVKKSGYRLIDTAKRYGCEEMLQGAIYESRIEREELFLSTKLWPRDYGLDMTYKAIEGSARRLGTEYLDLFMLHWPEVPSGTVNKTILLEETWRSLELAYDAGLCRAIGVSNYEIDHLEELFDTCSVKPHVNQIEFHPYNQRSHLLEFCQDSGIQVQGYCPLGKGLIVKDKIIIDIANRKKRTPAQVLLRWSLQKGVAPVPKSTKVERVAENIDVFGFALSFEEMALIDAIQTKRRFCDPKGIQSKIDSNLPDGYKLLLTDNVSARRTS